MLVRVVQCLRRSGLLFSGCWLSSIGLLVERRTSCVSIRRCVGMCWQSVTQIYMSEPLLDVDGLLFGSTESSV
jgi:hypothetical protein